MFQETSPETLNEIITMNEPGPGRLGAQPPHQRRRVSEASESIAELVQQHGYSSEDDESDGYSTPDEESGEELIDIVANHPESTNTRQFFTTPCGQTYWVDDEYLLYTNRNVQYPIGYWCDEMQAVVLDMFQDDDEYEDVPLSPVPPRYTPSSSEPDSSDEVEGETILIANSQ
jgi:hypothetical protein